MVGRDGYTVKGKDKLKGNVIRISTNKSTQ